MRASMLFEAAPARSSYCMSTRPKSPPVQALPFMPTMYAPSSYQIRGAAPFSSSGKRS